MAAATPQSRTARRAAPGRRPARSRATGETPWWMWIVVAAIVRLLPVPVLLAGQHLAEDGRATCQSSTIFPPHPTLDNYKSIFHNADFTRALRNSAIVALTTTVLGARSSGRSAPTRSRV